MNEIYTIGHSNNDISEFIELFRQHFITALCDVRSYPFSRYSQQYSQEPLKNVLTANDIAYMFLGKELGARSDNPACCKQGKVQYSRLANEPTFLEGIDRLKQGIKRYCISLMCVEKDPIECHTALFVARHLYVSGIQINHILADSSLECHEEMESRLLAVYNLPEGDMFTPRRHFVNEAYFLQGERVAYQNDAM